MIKPKKQKSKRAKSTKVGTAAKPMDPAKRLAVLTTLIILLTALMLTLATNFAPKIGAFFGFFSVHRNEKAQTLNTTLQPPIFVDVPEATSSITINIKGISEPTSTVKLYVNGPEKDSVITDLAGEFLFTNIELISGTNTIFAKAEMGNGKSEKSETLKIEVDKEKPELKVTFPQNGETIKNLNKNILVTGSVNEDAIVTVNGRLAILKADKTFEFLLGVEEGTFKIEVAAKDRAENEAKIVLDVRYEKRSF